MAIKQVYYFRPGYCLVLLLSLAACRAGMTSIMNNEVVKGPPEPPPKTISPTTTVETPLAADPTITPEPTSPAISPSAGEYGMIKISIVFDNYSVREGLTTGWGFSAHITTPHQTVLFDTGADGPTLLKNMSKMGIAPGEIQHILLSHEHNDHTNGLQSVLSAGAEPVIYLPPSFSSNFRNQFKNQAEIVNVAPGQLIVERIFTTGEIPGSVPEQALIIDTPQGLVVITGCAHPGVATMVRVAKRILHEEVYLVMGGFHLGDASYQQVEQIISELKGMGVEYVAPCHCTGLRSINQFKEAFGDKFIKVGVGAVIEIDL